MKMPATIIATAKAPTLTAVVALGRALTGASCQRGEKQTLASERPVGGRLTLPRFSAGWCGGRSSGTNWAHGPNGASAALVRRGVAPPGLLGLRAQHEARSAPRRPLGERRRSAARVGRHHALSAAAP